ncbi:uncharacterized protein LOC106669915 isoform X3 [Cimex lectularius]|uniref:Uncharacterized protein n=1 Tax=Cimex lectularius TaxID=79782 RepID=A0A8I6SK83_CIMLE|nr:uncharacterized protein LOC106669915 isoform X3 [Cimex lectularius]
MDVTLFANRRPFLHTLHTKMINRRKIPQPSSLAIPKLSKKYSYDDSESSFTIKSTSERATIINLNQHPISNIDESMTVMKRTNVTHKRRPFISSTRAREEVITKKSIEKLISLIDMKKRMLRAALRKSLVSRISQGTMDSLMCHPSDHMKTQKEYMQEVVRRTEECRILSEDIRKSSFTLNVEDALAKARAMPVKTIDLTQAKQNLNENQIKEVDDREMLVLLQNLLRERVKERKQSVFLSTRTPDMEWLRNSVYSQTAREVASVARSSKQSISVKKVMATKSFPQVDFISIPTLKDFIYNNKELVTTTSRKKSRASDVNTGTKTKKVPHHSARERHGGASFSHVKKAKSSKNRAKNKMDFLDEMCNVDNVKEQSPSKIANQNDTQASQRAVTGVSTFYKSKETDERVDSTANKPPLQKAIEYSSSSDEEEKSHEKIKNPTQRPLKRHSQIKRTLKEISDHLNTFPKGQEDSQGSMKKGRPERRHTDDLQKPAEREFSTRKKSLSVKRMSVVVPGNEEPANEGPSSAALARAKYEKFLREYNELINHSKRESIQEDKTSASWLQNYNTNSWENNDNSSLTRFKNIEMHRFDAPTKRDALIARLHSATRI